MLTKQVVLAKYPSIRQRGALVAAESGAIMIQGHAMQLGSSDQPTTGITDQDHFAGVRLPLITDETMRERLRQACHYTAVLLRRTDAFVRPDVDPVIWEHGRRNMALVEQGVLAIVLPADNDPTGWSGLGVFTATPDVVDQIMRHDPGVQAGIFTYELHPMRGFPGSSLPD